MCAVFLHSCKWHINDCFNYAVACVYVVISTWWRRCRRQPRLSTLRLGIMWMLVFLLQLGHEEPPVVPWRTSLYPLIHGHNSNALSSSHFLSVKCISSSILQIKMILWWFAHRLSLYCLLSHEGFDGFGSATAYQSTCLIFLRDSEHFRGPNTDGRAVCRICEQKCLFFFFILECHQAVYRSQYSWRV